MAAGRYYLGKYTNGMYVPVSESLCKNDVYSVMNFTSKFNSEEDLRKYLISQELIAGDEPLAYIIAKKDGYNKIYNGSYLTYSYANIYNTSGGMLNTLKSEKNNLELYAYIADMLSDKFEGVNVNIAMLRYIQEIVDELNHAYRIGINNYNESYDKKDIDHLIYLFLRSAIGKYDKQTQSYKTVGGALDVDRRSLFDLVLILNAYYDMKQRQYLEQLNKANEVVKDDEEEDEREEFLTEEDFIRLGEDPEDNRKLIRE